MPSHKKSSKKKIQLTNKLILQKSYKMVKLEPLRVAQLEYSDTENTIQSTFDISTLVTKMEH